MLTFGERLRAIDGARDLTANEVFILRILNEFAGGDGLAFPTCETIAFKTRLSVKTVYRFMSRFQSGGLIVRTPRYNERGKRLIGDLIHVAWDKLEAAARRARKPAQPPAETPLLDHIAEVRPIVQPSDTGHGVPSNGTQSPIASDFRSVVPQTPPYVLEHQGRIKQHTAKPPAESTAPKAPPSARERVCLINQFFEHWRGSAQELGSPSIRDLNLAGQVIDALGFQPAIVECRRLAERCRVKFPHLMHFAGSRPFWEEAIAAKKTSERRKRTQADNQRRQTDESSRQQHSANVYAEQRRQWQAEFEAQPPEIRDRWLTEAAKQLPAPARNTPFVKTMAAELFAKGGVS